MLAEAAQRLDDRPRETTLHEMDAQDLAFPDDSFETVISSLSTCTFPDPVEALSEMGRVCAPNGQILLLEHGRSSVGAIARFQDCEPTRTSRSTVAGGTRTHSKPWHGPRSRSSSAFFGIITTIEARPD